MNLNLFSIETEQHAMYEKLSHERHLLKISVYGAVFFSILGLVIGFLSHAQMIIFDGLYSLMSLSLSLISLMAQRFMSKVDLHNYPFGKDKIEPLVVIIKYIFIFIIVIGSSVNAVYSITTGGQSINFNLAILYSVFATALCIGITYYLKRAAKEVRSGLIHAEANQWFMDSLVSVGVLIGYILSIAIVHFTSYDFIVPYIDPIMVIIVALYFIRVPVRAINSALREILDMPPKGKIPDQIKLYVKKLKQAYLFKESFTRVSKVGQTLWVEVDFVVIPNETSLDLALQDKIREQINHYLNQYPYDIWLTVSFTEDRKWAL